MQYSFHTVTIT